MIELAIIVNSSSSGHLLDSLKHHSSALFRPVVFHRNPPELPALKLSLLILITILFHSLPQLTLRDKIQHISLLPPTDLFPAIYLIHSQSQSNDSIRSSSLIIPIPN